MSDSSRLFFALWPDDETRLALAHLSQSIGINEFRWAPPHNFHVTLVFLGQVDADVELLLKQSVASITAQPFTLSFDRLSYWSGPKILCLTCRLAVSDDDCMDAGGTTPGKEEVESRPEQRSRATHGAVADDCMDAGGRATHGAVAEAMLLAAALEAAAASCGLHTDPRPYVPHITLARHVRYLPDVNIEPISWRAEAFCLVESCSEPDGVNYKVIQRWPFSKPGTNLT